MTKLAKKKALGWNLEQIKEEMENHWKWNLKDSKGHKKEKGVVEANVVTGGKRFKGDCNNCGKQGHKKADCWAKGGGKEGQGPKGKGKKKDDVKDEDKHKNVVCNRCKQKGHIARNCPEKNEETGMFVGCVE